jgi:hypothetical protein
MSRYDIYICLAMTGRKVREVLLDCAETKALLSAYGLSFYCPADDEGLEKLDPESVISNAFDEERMRRYVTKDLAAVGNSRALLNVTGDRQSDGCLWEMAFATFHRFIPVHIVAPQRVTKAKMSFTNILVDRCHETLGEAVFALSEKLKECD